MNIESFRVKNQEEFENFKVIKQMRKKKNKNESRLSEQKKEEKSRKKFSNGNFKRNSKSLR